MKRGKDMGNIACNRIKALAKEIGADIGYRHGWTAEAARCMGLKYGTLHQIMRRNGNSKVSTKTITTVSRQIGLSPNELMSEDKNGY